MAFLKMTSPQQFLSPAKLFAKLKCNVLREDTRAMEAVEKPRVNFNSLKRHNVNAGMSEELRDEQRVGPAYTEVEPLTLSPIPSPQKRCRYSDRAVLDMSSGTGRGQTQAGRALLVSTALSRTSSWVNTIQTFKDPPQIRDVSIRTPVKTHTTDRDGDRSVCVDQPHKVFSPMRSRLRKRKSLNGCEKSSLMSPAKLFAFMKEKETNSPKHLYNTRRKLYKSQQVRDAHLSSFLTDSDSPDDTTNAIAPKNSLHSCSSGSSSEDVLLSNSPINDDVFTQNNDREKHPAGFNPGDTRQASPVASPQIHDQIEISPKSEEEYRPPRSRGSRRPPLESTAISQPLGIKDLKSLVSSMKDIFSPIKSRLRTRNWALKDYKRRGESRNDCSQSKKRTCSALMEDHSTNTSIEDAEDDGKLPVNQSEVIPEPRVPHMVSNVEKRLIESEFRLMSPAKMFNYMKTQENKREPQTLHHARREALIECEVHLSRIDDPAPPAQTRTDREDVTVTTPNQSNGDPALIQFDPSSDEDVPVPAVRPKPVLFEDPLVLNSPRVFIPKRPEAVFKRNQWPKQVQFPNEIVIYLKKWFLRKNNMGLFVQGIHREENIYWNSSIITERISTTVLKTASGKVYILVGKMSMENASDFPRWILFKYAKGFPSNWKDLYEKLLLESTSKKSTKTKKSSVGGKAVKTLPANAIDSSVKQSKKHPFKTPEPCSPPSSASHLNMSRSGRVLKAPLEYWKGGRVMLDADMNVTIHEAYETSMCNSDTTSIVSLGALQPNAHTADSRKNKSTVGKEDLVPTRKVKVLIHPQSTNNVGTAEKVSKTDKLQMEAPKTSSRTTRSNKQSPTTEELTHVETDPRKERKKQSPPTGKHTHVETDPQKGRKTHWKQKDKKQSPTVVKQAHVEMDSRKERKRQSPTTEKQTYVEMDSRKERKRQSPTTEKQTHVEMDSRKGRKRQSPTTEKQTYVEMDSRKGRNTPWKQKDKKPSPTTEKQTHVDTIPRKERKRQSPTTEKPTYVEMDSRKGRNTPWKQKDKKPSPTTEKQTHVDTIPRKERKRQSPNIEKHTHVEIDSRKGRNTPWKQRDKKQEADRTTTQTSGTKQAKKNAVDPDKEDEEKWTEAELKKLEEAVSYYPKHILGYWERVSQMVESRSAEECYNQHVSLGTSQTASKKAEKVQKKKKKKEVGAPKDPDLPVITARAGTLKRKRQVRQYLDTMAKDNIDDVFSSAYMQDKRFEMPSFCPSDDDNFSIPDMNMEPLTPKSNVYPQVKTPQCLCITPGMMGSPNRSNNDQYVYQMQKRMKRSRFNVNKYSPTAKKFQTTPSVKKAMKRCNNAENSSFAMWEMFPGNDAALSDSGEEEDVYFSEND